MHAEVALLSRQKFTPIKIWRERCSDEQERARDDPSPIVKFVSDLEKETAQMLYILRAGHALRDAHPLHDAGEGAEGAALGSGLRAVRSVSMGEGESHN